jgi:hypothetical protein
VTGKQWKWTGWMAFSVILLVVFSIATYRNVQEIRDAQRATATVVEPPVLSPAGESEIATAKVRFVTEEGNTVEIFVIGVPVDAAVGDPVTIHYLGANPSDATVDDPPNLTLGLVLSSMFALIGAGGIWTFGHEFPFREEDDATAIAGGPLPR